MSDSPTGPTAVMDSNSYLPFPNLEDRFKMLVSVVKDYAIFMLDRQGYITTWNPGAENINGYAASEIIGKHFSIFYPEEDIRAGKPQRELEIAAREGQVEDENWRVRKDGSKIWVNVVITALRDEQGQLIGFAKITRDLTERRMAEQRIRDLNEALANRTAQLESANKELEAFTYSVAHDLRAPLRHIEGFSKLLVDGYSAELPEDAQECIQFIRDGTRQMGRLVDDLLRLAGIGRKELSFSKTALRTTVETAIAELAMECQGRNIEWRVGELPVLVCDAALIKQVFANLLANAVKFTRNRETAVIEIASTRKDGQIVFFVRDNGAGFDMQFVDKLFRVFQRLHLQEEFEGTGIGLAIVHRIVQKHGGQVWAEGASDQGATFYFSLPQQK